MIIYYFFPKILFASFMNSLNSTSFDKVKCIDKNNTYRIVPMSVSRARDWNEDNDINLFVNKSIAATNKAYKYR